MDLAAYWTEFSPSRNYAPIIEQALKPRKSKLSLCLYLETPETNVTSAERNSERTLKRKTGKNSAVRIVKSSMRTRKNRMKKRKSASFAD